MENARTLKQRRASAKGVLTKAITHVSEALIVGGDIMEVQAMQERLIRVFSSFKEACDDTRILWWMISMSKNQLHICMRQNQGTLLDLS